MARKKQRRFQLLRDIVLGGVVLMMVGMILGGIAKAAFVFMLTGIVEGTTVVVPVWGMFILYSAIALFIGIIIYIDYTLEKFYLHKIQSARQLPRRRYSSTKTQAAR